MCSYFIRSLVIAVVRLSILFTERLEDITCERLHASPQCAVD